MGNLKERLIRVGFWMLFVCVPASVSILYLEATQAPPPIIPEIANLSNEIQTLHTPADAKTAEAHAADVGTEIAGEKEKKPNEHGHEKTVDMEQFMTFLTHSHAQQMAIIKDKNNAVDSMKTALASQSEKMELLFQLVQKQEQQFSDLMNKTKKLEAQVSEKVQVDAQNQQKISRLFSTISTDKAVKIAEGIEDDTLAKIMSNMKEKDVATLIAALPAKRAATLTLKMGDFTRSK